MRQKAQDFVVNNVGRIKSIIIKFDDGNAEGTFRNLSTAISCASDSELENFIKTGSIPFEDGILTIKFKRR